MHRGTQARRFADRRDTQACRRRGSTGWMPRRARSRTVDGGETLTRRSRKGAQAGQRGGRGKRPDLQLIRLSTSSIANVGASARSRDSASRDGNAAAAAGAAVATASVASNSPGGGRCCCCLPSRMSWRTSTLYCTSLHRHMYYRTRRKHRQICRCCRCSCSGCCCCCYSCAAACLYGFCCVGMRLLQLSLLSHFDVMAQLARAPLRNTRRSTFTWIHLTPAAGDDATAAVKIYKDLQHCYRRTGRSVVGRCLVPPKNDDVIAVNITVNLARVEEPRRPGGFPSVEIGESAWAKV